MVFLSSFPGLHNSGVRAWFDLVGERERILILKEH
jgi:hypothetical protein